MCCRPRGTGAIQCLPQELYRRSGAQVHFYYSSAPGLAASAVAAFVYFELRGRGMDFDKDLRRKLWDLLMTAEWKLHLRQAVTNTVLVDFELRLRRLE